jgi:hypothetical protein
LHHQTQNLFRILGFVEQRVDVGVNDVTESGKNAHGGKSFAELLLIDTYSSIAFAAI